MDKKLVIRIPRRDNPACDESMSTAMAMINACVEDWKKLLTEIQYGGAHIDATVKAGRVVQINVIRTTHYIPS